MALGPLRVPCAPLPVRAVELHPYLAQPELVAYCKEQGIALMAYSPLGSADSYSGRSFPAQGSHKFECASGGATLLENSVVRSIAERHGATAAQVLISWSAMCGFCCLPKSVRPERIEQNLAAPAACPLSDIDLKALAELNCGFRYGIGPRQRSSTHGVWGLPAAYAHAYHTPCARSAGWPLRIWCTGYMPGYFDCAQATQLSTT